MPKIFNKRNVRYNSTHFTLKILHFVASYALIMVILTLYYVLLEINIRDLMIMILLDHVQGGILCHSILPYGGHV
ncbi:hypothetical protein Defa_11110 [Desulfovibrio sp. TH_2024_36128]|uniref:Uncharacterized protein n=1 Tax=Desulfovibrio falkowii TaxID=3136602 RepID=A0ABQ0E7A6_9BACT